MLLYGIVGAGGFGREVMPVAKEYIGMVCQDAFRLVFIDDGVTEKLVNGYEVLSTEEFFSTPADEYLFNIAIGSGRTRERVAEAMLGRGARPFNIYAVSGVRLDGNSFGEGAVLCPLTIITSNAKIGKFFQANIYSYVAHDCVIGDFVTFAPGVKCNGNVIVENHAYIGTGAIIKQGTPERPIIIGEGAIVGMGAVVTKSVSAGDTVVGNPAKPLGRKGLGG
ncbi:acetyltransferase [Pseudomonas auratipiscis]|uniref:Acetyltransferase n=1 Tax=Pseudomonas auratipiscis TaxID=3115853 RepID=A0AB35WR18_9PSED|nr:MULTISPECIES: acetyltransferase [unclassified Pseudomonas]MEE1867146.1 acetyltransferase [Pseudomonas sp. 120P]MEE1957973.1 acetyltransferase [Pseudomonas sp. 119P]